MELKAVPVAVFGSVVVIPQLVADCGIDVAGNIEVDCVSPVGVILLFVVGVHCEIALPLNVGVEFPREISGDCGADCV